MEIEILRAELERLFELDELLALSKDVLGFDPEQVGGTAGKGSFVRALTEHCAERDAVEALCDALFSSKPDVDPKIGQLRVHGLPGHDDLSLGSQVDGYTILKKLGTGTAGICYVARKGERDYRLKVLRSEATRDRRSLHRFLALTRLTASIDNPHLPANVSVGSVGSTFFIAHDHVDAQPLAARISRTGPMHINEARDLLMGVLRALGELHARRLTHGNLKLENVLAWRDADGNQRVRLLDAGGDRLRERASLNGRSSLLSVSAPNTIAPEQLRGSLPSERSDVYSFGALMFEILTGKPVFAAPSVVDALVAHLTEPPRVPSEVAPRGWIPSELDEFLTKLLNKSPDDRPRNVDSVLERIETIGRPSMAPKAVQITDENLVERIDAVIAAPENEEAALALESAADEGADPIRIADAFAMAAEQLEEDPESAGVRKGLLYRAGRLYQEASNLDAAERTFLTLVELDPTDETAQVKLEDVRRRLGKYEELIEALLERAEQAENSEARARVMAQIGRLYVTELDDPEQALVAYTQAFCEDPRTSEYADKVEQLAGNKHDAWSEVLGSCTEASTGDQPTEVKNPLFVKMGRWYAEKYSRPDLALQCFQAVLATEPANEPALDGLAAVYRKGQQWAELASTLLRQAEITTDPSRARSLRCDAAEISESRLNDPNGARDLYGQVLEADPGHEKATEALARIYEQTNDYAGLVKLLDQRARALRGEEKHRVQNRIAEIYEDRLKDDAEAWTHYTHVLDEDPENLDALRGLDRLYSKSGRFKELVENLRVQVRLAATPRQKIALWERIAGIYDEEFLDHAEVARALEAILEVDPDHDAALSALARHYRALERWEDLVELYGRQLSLVTDKPRRLQLTLDRAKVIAEHVGSTDQAIEAYEQVLELDSEHAEALESLAQLRETAGQEDAALEAIDALAAKAETTEAKVEQLLRAAKLLHQRGDLDGAITRYKRALDVSPTDSNINALLRTAHVERGEVNAAIELIEREIERTEGDGQKAQLAADMARLSVDHLKDDERAERAAKRSLDYDPTNIDALTVLGDLAFEAKRYVEASSFYEKLASRSDSLEHDEAVRVLMRFVDSLASGGSTEKALAAMDTLLRLAPDNPSALQRVASVTFEHGSPKRARALYRDLLERFGDEIARDDKAVATYRFGEATRISGDLDAAIPILEDAADLDPSSPLPLIALAQAHEAKEQWDKVIDVKQRHLDLAEGEKRVALLIEVGELAANKLSDRTLATKSLVAAVDERPDDRKLLMRLMQLYSEEKDWLKLIDVVLKLADFVDDKKQKAKYLQTAAMVAGREMSDFDQAVQFLEQVQELDPGNEKAIDDTIEFLEEKGDYEATVEALKQKATTASEARNTERMLDAFNKLGVLYKEKLGRIGHAIDAHEAAQTIDPDNEERNELLAELYASDPEKYLDKAIAAQMVMLQKNPFREASYKLLRRLYTENKRADPAWCLCQALYVLKLAEPDEERFFKRMRSEDPAYAQAVLTEDEWLKQILHADADPILTSVFALIEPAIIATRSETFEELGYDERYAVDPSQHPYPMSQTIHYAAGVTGLDCPPVFENPNDPGGLSFLHAKTPSIVLGNAALSTDLPPQATAFIAARHLAYYRPGLYMRHLVPSGTGLKSWLFAAIKMNAPQFPVSPEIEGPVKEATVALEKNLSPQVRDHLARIVSKLLQSGRSLDLKKWVYGVDLTADRVGFVLAHDLETAVEIIRASDESSSSLPPQQRLKDLVLFAISDPYFELRQHLQITIDT